MEKVTIEENRKKYHQAEDTYLSISSISTTIAFWGIQYRETETHALELAATGKFKVTEGITDSYTPKNMCVGM